MKYLSLFSGIGGFELGIQQAYEELCNNEHAHISKESKQEERSQRRKRSADLDGVQLHLRDRPTPLCIGYSEIDKYAIQVYNKHFNHKNYGDITKINPSDLCDFELLVGGFPCQSFSIAGKRGGFADTRGTLFFEISRIIRKKQPRLLLLENVKGLLSHDKGDTFTTIISTLDELGYDCQWQVLNSKNFGVPQNRERVFIVGHLRGTSRPEVFPIREQYSTNKGEVVGTLMARDYKGVGNQEMALAFRNDFTKIRRLTPKECERLQGFPDDWTKQGYSRKHVNNGVSGTVEISDTQRYKMCGNAVTVNVIKEIMLKLI